MRMTRADYRIRRDKLESFCKPQSDGIVFDGIQIVMLGSLIGVAALMLLGDFAGQGR